jgi:hypothetical protein
MPSTGGGAVAGARQHTDEPGVVRPRAYRVLGYPFAVALPDGFPVHGGVFAGQVKCLDWRARQARPIGVLPPGGLASLPTRTRALLRWQARAAVMPSPRSAAWYDSSCMVRLSSAGDRASLPASTARVARRNPVGGARAHFAIRGHTSRGGRRHGGVAIELATGSRTVSGTRSWTAAARRRKTAPRRGADHATIVRSIT